MLSRFRYRSPSPSRRSAIDEWAFCWIGHAVRRAVLHFVVGMPAAFSTRPVLAITAYGDQPRFRGHPNPSSGTASSFRPAEQRGNPPAQSATGVTYAVATNGRVTFAGGGGGSTPLIYLVSPNKGFALFVDSQLY